MALPPAKWDEGDVSLGGLCPSDQTIEAGGLRISPYLMRGRIPARKANIQKSSGSSTQKAYVAGLSANGHIVRLSKHSTFKTPYNDGYKIFTSEPSPRKHVSASGPDGQFVGGTSWVPFNVCFDLTRLADVKCAVTNPQDTAETQALYAKEESALKKFYEEGMVPSNTPAFHNETFAGKGLLTSGRPQPRRSRGIAHHLTQVWKKNEKNSTIYQYFSFPAFKLHGHEFPREVWDAVEQFQSAHPLTLISKVQVVYAVLTYFWATDWNTPKPEETHTQRPLLNIGVFVAYFPTYMRYHEIMRLGGYEHPFTLMDEWYRKDCEVSDDFKISNEDTWDNVFTPLKNRVLSPFALLTPPMHEGSAMAGPFLPLTQGLTLRQVQLAMGVGSIYTIGMPLFPCDHDLAAKSHDKVKTRFALVAYPKTWSSEIPGKVRITFPTNCKLAERKGFWSVVVPPNLLREVASIPKSEEDLCLKAFYHQDSKTPIIYHIGNDPHFVGAGLDHPGWSNHLPMSTGVLACHTADHDIGTLETAAMATIDKIVQGKNLVTMRKKLMPGLRFTWSEGTNASPNPAPLLQGLRLDGQAASSGSRLEYITPDFRSPKTIPTQPATGPLGRNPGQSGEPSPVGNTSVERVSKQTHDTLVARLRAEIKQLKGGNGPSNEDLVTRLTKERDELGEKVQTLETAAAERQLRDNRWVHTHSRQGGVVGEEGPTSDEIAASTNQEEYEAMAEEALQLKVQLKVARSQVARLEQSHEIQSRTDAELEAIRLQKATGEETIVSQIRKLKALEEQQTEAHEKAYRTGLISQRVSERELIESAHAENFKLKGDLKKLGEAYERAQADITALRRYQQQQEEEAQEAAAGDGPHSNKTVKWLANCRKCLQPLRCKTCAEDHAPESDALQEQRAKEKEEKKKASKEAKAVRKAVERLKKLDKAEDHRKDVKRKLDDAFYETTSQGSAKRVRCSADLPAVPSDISKDHDQKSFIATWNNEVMTASVRGGLVNPLHFDVKEDGCLAITAVARDRSDLYWKHQSQPAMIRAWKKEILTKTIQWAKACLKRNGFMEDGPASLSPLQQKLATKDLDEEDIDVAALTKLLSNALNEMDPHLDALRAWIDGYETMNIPNSGGHHIELTKKSHAILKPFFDGYGPLVHT